MTVFDAQTLALHALGWLAGQDADFEGFLAETSLGREDLARRAAEPETLAAILAFIAADESRARAFCTSRGLGPEALHGAIAALPGGDAPHWT